MLENLLRGLLGGGQPTASQQSGHRDYLDLAQGDGPYDTEAEVVALIGDTAHSDFYKIWEYTVPAQQRAAWGYGSAGLPRNQGLMWFVSMDEGTDFDVGFLRIMQADANGYHPLVIATLPDSALHGTTTTNTEAAHPDQDNMIPLPEKREYPLVGEDSKMQLWYALRVTATTHDACAFDIPITRYVG